MSDNSINDLIKEVETKSQEFSKAQKKIQKVKKDLRDKVNYLWEEDVLKKEEKEKALKQVDRGEYGKVRKTIKEAKQGVGIDFDDKEKEEFAKAFKTTFDSLEAFIEEIRNELISLTDSINNEDMIAYIYGKHSGMRKGDLRKAFDIIDSIKSTNVSENDIARFMAAKTSKLTISDCKEIIKEIRKGGR